jgi:hypothetical protein
VTPAAASWLQRAASALLPRAATRPAACMDQDDVTGGADHFSAGDFCGTGCADAARRMPVVVRMLVEYASCGHAEARRRLRTDVT